MFNRLFKPDGTGTIIKMCVISPAMKSRAKRVGSGLMVSTVAIVLAACGTDDPKPQTVIDLTCGSQKTEFISRKTTLYKEYDGTNPRLVSAMYDQVSFLKGKKDYFSVESFKKAMLDKKVFGSNTVDEAYQEMCKRMKKDFLYQWEDGEMEIEYVDESYGG